MAIWPLRMVTWPNVTTVAICASGSSLVAVMSNDTVAQRELVVLLVADGAWADESLRQLRRVWDAAIDVLGLTKPVAGYGDRLPTHGEEFPAGAAPVAVRRHPERPVQVVVRRARRDRYLLSALVAPEAGEAWPEAEALWDDVRRAADVGPLLGARSLLLGKVSDDVADLAVSGPWPGAGAVTSDGRCAAGAWSRRTDRVTGGSA